MKHIDLEQLILYYYDEPEEPNGRTSNRMTGRAAIEGHLAVCSRCRDERDALVRTLAAVSSVPVPERGASYGQEVWHRLEPRLRQGVNHGVASPVTSGDRDERRERAGERRGWGWFEALAWQRWTIGGALAALLVAAFLAGRFWPRPGAPGSPTAAPVSAQARDRVLLSAVADHMERSEILLMELENASGGGGKEVDISLQREQAEELAVGSRLYEQAAQQAGETGISNLLDDLGRVLVTVAHSPSRVTPAQLADLRTRIEGPGILFKLQVVDSGIEQRLKPAPGRAGSRNVQD